IGGAGAEPELDIRRQLVVQVAAGRDFDVAGAGADQAADVDVAVAARTGREHVGLREVGAADQVVAPRQIVGVVAYRVERPWQRRAPAGGRRAVVRRNQRAGETVAQVGVEQQASARAQRQDAGLATEPRGRQVPVVYQVEIAFRAQLDARNDGEARVAGLAE